MTKERKIFQHPKSKEICEIYKLLLKDGLVSFPITNDSVNSVDSIVSNIKNAHFGVEIYNTNEEKAVSYFYFLIKNHPFTDGNKRTAVLSFLSICKVNNLNIDKDNYSLDELAVFIEKSKIDHQLEIKNIARKIFIN